MARTTACARPAGRALSGKSRRTLAGKPCRGVRSARCPGGRSRVAPAPRAMLNRENKFSFPGSAPKARGRGMKKSASEGSIASPVDTFLALRTSAVEAATTWGAAVLDRVWTPLQSGDREGAPPPPEGAAPPRRRSASVGVRTPESQAQREELGATGGKEESDTSAADQRGAGVGLLPGVGVLAQMYQKTLLALEPVQEDITAFLRATTTSELLHARKMASLSGLTYALDRLTPRNLDRLHKMLFVSSSRCCEVPTVSPLSASQAMQAGDGGAAGVGSLLSDTLLDPVTTSLPLRRSVLSSVDSTVAEALAAADRAGESIERHGAPGKPIPSSVNKTTGFQTGDCPSEWFVCDDPATATRCFVIQGSDSVESWRTNLTFDPVVFEDAELGCKVHRGVYMAALSLYDKFLPLVEEHLNSSPFARVTFTGHSLGGSLATCLAIMYKYRGVILAEQLAPIYTFGAAAVHHELPVPAAHNSGPDSGPAAAADANGAEQDGASAASSAQSTPTGSMASPKRGISASLLARVGLPPTCVSNIVMHRDIVPRAFACDYSPVVPILASGALGASFVDHIESMDEEERTPLYAFVGQMSVLQPPEDMHFVMPDEGFHALLPKEPGLFRVAEPSLVSRALARAAGRDDPPRAPHGTSGAADTLHKVQMLLLDNPHPLETLADLRSFGDDGAISRYHNPDHYTKSLTAVLHAEKRKGRMAAALQAAMPWRRSKAAKKSFKPNVASSCVDNEVDAVSDPVTVTPRSDRL